MFGSVNKDLLPIKAHYFLFNAATGPIVPFLPTIAKQLGFSGILLGAIYTILPISGLIAKPLFGAIADKFKLHKALFLTFQVILTIGFFSIYFITPVDKTANVVLTCDKVAFLEACSKNGFSEKTLHEVIPHFDHVSTYNSSCQLSCKAEREHYQELCTNWHAKHLCDIENISNSTDATFNFIATFNMPKNLNSEKCTYLRVVDVKFEDGSVQTPNCLHQLRTSCITTCHHNPVLNHLLNEIEDTVKVEDTSTYQFHLFLWGAVVSWIGMAVVVSIADAICFKVLGHEGQRLYGKQKMWGSVGFGIFCISAGYLIDVFSKGQPEKDYTCIFYIMIVAMIVDIIVSATIKTKNPECSELPLLWEILTLAKDCKVLIFGWWCIGAGMCTGVVWNFLFWYTEDLATASQVVWLKTLQGLLTGVQCFLGEMPFNFVSGSVLKKLGHVNVMSLVLLIYAIRFMAYSVVSNPWLFLIVEILHGPSLGLCWPTMVSYADKVTPSGTKATIQGFVGAIFEGIGVSCGSLLCGWLIDTYGGVITFRVFSGGALAWLTIFWLMQLFLQRTKTRSTYQVQYLDDSDNPDDLVLMAKSQEMQTY